VQLEQGAAGGLDELAELGGRDLDPLVDPIQFSDQFGGQLAARLATRSRGRTVASKALAWVADRNV